MLDGDKDRVRERSAMEKVMWFEPPHELLPLPNTTTGVASSPTHTILRSTSQTSIKREISERLESFQINPDEKPSGSSGTETKDTVPGLLYYLLQKEVIALRKAGRKKDQIIKDKDDAIEMLAKKVDTLTKAMEVEAKKRRREVAAMEKEVAAMRIDKEQDNRAKRFANVKNTSQLPARYAK
ncbi:putative microtubule-associated protein [Helianthus anomalus]